MNALVQSEQHAIATQPVAQTAGPMALAIQAMQAGMTIESLQGLMGLQKEWEANEARKAYVADMAEFKRNPPQIYKDKQVGFTNRDGEFVGYSHASLGSIAKSIMEALAIHGFSYSWETKQVNGVITVTCKITHRLGHSESTSMESTADTSGKKNSIQAIASAVTYLSRYTLLSACGMATLEMPDDDGVGYEDVPARTTPQAAPQQPEGNGLPVYSDEQFAKNLPTWRGLIETGKKSAEQVIATVESRACMTPEQKAMVRATVVNA